MPKSYWLALITLHIYSSENLLLIFVEKLLIIIYHKLLFHIKPYLSDNYVDNFLIIYIYITSYFLSEEISNY